MYVQLKTTLDCTPDVAWRALQSPSVMRELYAPVMRAESLEPGGYPTIWTPGDHRVELRLGGVLPIGRQLISLDLDDTRSDGVRMLRDSGIPLSGPLSRLTSWNHRMAVSPVDGAGDKTLYRDRLEFTGAIAPLVWATLWDLWQCRERRLQSLASTWAFDPEVVG